MDVNEMINFEFKYRANAKIKGFQTNSKRTWLSFRSSLASISRYPSARSSSMASFTTAAATSFVISRILQICMKLWNQEHA